MTRLSRFFPHSRLITEEQAHVQRVESSWGKSLRLRRRLYLDLFHWQIWIHVGHSSDGISQSLHTTTTTHCQQSYNQTKPLSIIWTSPSCWQHNRAQSTVNTLTLAQDHPSQKHYTISALSLIQFLWNSLAWRRFSCECCRGSVASRRLITSPCQRHCY